MNDETDAQSNPNNVEWINSNGGPLLLLSCELLPEWDGINPPTGDRHIQADFRWLGPHAPATDYDRAADVQDFFGKIAVGNGWALVLGGEPMLTCWLPSPMEHGGVLVRWQDGEDDESVLASVSHVPEHIWQKVPFSFDVGQAPLYLFDAAYPGSAVQSYLKVELRQDNYSMETAFFKPEDFTSIVLHRFSPHSRHAAQGGK